MSLWHGNLLCEEELEDLERSTVFTSSEIEMLYERFKYLDRSNTGFLTFAEFQMIPEFYSNPFSKLITTHLEGLNSFEKVSFASYLEFLEIFSGKNDIDTRVSFLFSIFDIDKDGHISEADLAQILVLMTGKADDTQIRGVLVAFDEGSKGYLDYTDFTNFYNSDPAIEKNMVLDFGGEPTTGRDRGFWASIWPFRTQD